MTNERFLFIYAKTEHRANRTAKALTGKKEKVLWKLQLNNNKQF